MLQQPRRTPPSCARPNQKSILRQKRSLSSEYRIGFTRYFWQPSRSSPGQNFHRCGTMFLGPSQDREYFQEEYSHDSTHDSSSGFCSHLLSPHQTNKMHTVFLACWPNHGGSGLAIAVSCDQYYPKTRLPTHHPGIGRGCMVEWDGLDVPESEWQTPHASTRMRT
jgi:hypothetical protein